MPDPIVLDVPAASSPAAVSTPLDPSAVLGSLTQEERFAWKKTGALPDTVTVRSAASPAAPAVEDQPASTDAPSEPASEPAKEYKTKTAKRIQELLDAQTRATERADRLERELTALRPPPPDARPAASSAAPAGKPDPSTFAFGTADPEYLDALTDYKVATTLATQRQTEADRVAGVHRQADGQRLAAAWDANQKAAIAKFPDWPAVVGRVPTANLPSYLQPGTFGESFVFEDPDGALVLYHLLSHPDEASRLEPFASDARRLHRELITLGARITAAPVVKTTTTAPDPAPVLGARAGAGADAVATAIKTRDVGAYIREQNARDAATGRFRK